LHDWVSNNHKERLKYLLVWKNGKLERASWNEAMGLIAKNPKEVRERLTSHGIGFNTTGQLFLEECYVLAAIGKAELSTLHMDGNEVVIKSQRGAIQVPATVSKIANRQIFIPFYYDYWDKADGSAASAANELTFGIYKSSLPYDISLLTA
jgi:predicted molibdopterin-dependent oxidoreductase YjgC